RGDVLNVTSFPFEDGFLVIDEPTFLEQVQPFQRPGIALLALLLTFFVAMRVTRTLRQPETAAIGALEGGARGGKLDVRLGDGEHATAELPAGEADIALPPPGPTTRDLVAAHVEESPDVAVQLIRAWMKEE
ncbi:MAG: hypothetical protein WD031_03525, partial [Gemmatimonadota bacterium]